MKYKNLTIIGTSHISPESIKKVEKTINEQKPAVVAIELDKGRLHGLLSKAKGRPSPMQVGLFGFLFALIGMYLQKKLGKYVGVEPGSEMLAAYRTARANNLQVRLIDQNIEITLRSLRFGFKEFINLFVDLFNSLFFPKRELEKLGIKTFDLSKVPSMELIEKLIERTKTRYPSIYKALIADRDKIMARRLYTLMHEHQDVVAVVGAGHEQGMIKILKALFETKSDISYSLTVS